MPNRDMVFNADLLGRVRSAAHIALMIGTFAALAPSSLFAASSVTLTWDPSTSTNIAGYKVYYGPASRTYTNTLDVGNATSTIVSNLVTGAIYYFTATVYDTNDLESDFSNEVGYTNTDLASPTIVLTSPANKSASTAPATLTLAASVTPNGHAITAVQFYNGNTLLGERTNAPYAFTWGSVAAGNYSLSAQAVYDASNTVASSAALVAVTKEVPPAIALSSPADGSAFTAPATISLAANVTANGHTITAVQFYNGTNLLGANATAPYVFTWNSVAAGNYTLSAQVVYDSGTVVVSTPANVTVTNLPPPAIALTSPADNSAFAAPATISLAANVTANGHTITKVQFYYGATLLAVDATAPYVFTWNGVAAGNYALTAQAFYDSGSTVASPAANVTVTNLLPPAIALTSPANNSAFAAPAAISLAANVTANGHAITKVQFYNGATLLGEQAAAPYALTWNNVTAGNYTLTAQAFYDSGSTVASPAANVTVTNLLPPTIALTSPANNSAFAAPATISLAADVAANGHAITKVQFYNGATLLGEQAAAPYALTWNNVTAGNYTLTAQAFYDSGSTVASPAANVTVTNLLPPTIALTSPANNSAFAAPATISLAANVTANGHVITKVQFYNGATLLGEQATAPYALTWNNVAAGNYTLTAQAFYDSGSTVASPASNVTVTNLLSPAIALTSPADGSAFTAPATISLTASVTTNGHTISAVEFYNGATLLGESTNTPYAFTWDNVPAGAYSLTARLVYDLGATLDSTPAVNVLVAAPRPPDVAPTISPIADQTTPQDTATPEISFTVGDAQTAASNLTVYAFSADLALVPTNNIVFGGTNADRTITLTPAPGATGNVAITVFVSDGSLTTNTTFQLAVTPTLTPWRLGLITLSTNLNAQPVTNSSTYTGLFYEDDAVRQASAGSFTLSVTPRGAYSGRLQIGTNSYSISGSLNSQRTGATNVISRRGSPALTLDFQFGLGGQTNQVTGHLTDGTWTATLCGDRAVFGRANPAPFAGNYTLVIPGYDANPSLPAGDGFGSVKVNSSGQVSFVGTLADGTKVSQSTTVSGSGYWPLYLPLYSGNGSLMSWVAFASNTNSDLAGRLIWLKQAVSASKYYPAGFTCECEALGSVYRSIYPVLNLPTASLMFCGGAFASDITNSITIGSRNQVGTPGKQLKLSFSASTGTFSGTFLDPTSNKSLPFSGAVFQKLNAGYGVLFGTGTQSSEVLLTPN
jgi:sulfur relay (sulfurtransferase) complex TusBCD TusD component (DsrE family)